MPTIHHVMRKMASQKGEAVDPPVKICEKEEKVAGKIFKCCGKSSKVVVCSSCVGVFHASCARRMANVRFSDDGDGVSICCCSSESAAVINNSGADAVISTLKVDKYVNTDGCSKIDKYMNTDNYIVSEVIVNESPEVDDDVASSNDNGVGIRLERALLELDYLRELKLHLSKRLDDQEKIISLLQRRNNYCEKALINRVSNDKSSHQVFVCDKRGRSRRNDKNCDCNLSKKKRVAVTAQIHRGQENNGNMSDKKGPNSFVRVSRNDVDRSASEEIEAMLDGKVTDELSEPSSRAVKSAASLSVATDVIVGGVEQKRAAFVDAVNASPECGVSKRCGGPRARESHRPVTNKNLSRVNGRISDKFPASHGENGVNPVSALKEAKKVTEAVRLDPRGSEGKTIQSRKRSTVVMGTRSNSNSGSQDTLLKSAPKLSFVHLYRLDPDTSELKVAEYVSNVLGINVIGCERLNSRRPEAYSSFKLTVDQMDEPQLLDPVNWPRGVCLRKFFTRNRPVVAQKT